VGNFYVIGRTSSADFPVIGTSFSRSGGDELFVVKLHRTGMPQWSMIYGGTSTDAATALALDSSGNIAVVGFSASTDFPTTAGAYQATIAGLNDGIVLFLGGYLLSLELEPLADTVLCTNDTLTLRWSVRGGEFAPENFFVVELSDAGGSFRAPLRLDSLQARRDTVRRVFIPAQPLGGQYRLRIAATKPIAYSNDNGRLLSALQRPREPHVGIDGDTVFCEGRRAVLYIVEPQAGVHYRWWRDSTIVADDAPMYAVMESGRYTAEAYNACGSAWARRSFTVTVYPLPRRPLITPGGDVRLCSGDTLELRITGEPGVSYLWYRNDTALTRTQDTVLRVWEAGTYTVEARNTCGAVRSQNSARVRVLPRPPKPVIGRRGDTLVSSAVSGNQWLDENKQPIPGATGREFVPPRDGTYYVQVTMDSCSSVSDPYVFVRSSVGEVGTEGIVVRVEPNPVQEVLHLWIEGVRGNVLVELLDPLGRCLFQRWLWLDGTDRLTLPATQWAAGVYAVRLTWGERQVYRLFVKP
jgi:hypothetical protein